MRHLRTLGAISLIVITVACAPLTATTCTTGDVSTSTRYTRLSLLPALAHNTIHINTFRVSAAPLDGYRCGWIVLTKHLTLLRGSGPIQIIEIRNFYTHGRLVAVHKKIISNELPISGRYRARVRLPIPPQTPYGRYHIVSLLYVRLKPNTTPILVARANTTFSVVR